MVLKKAIAVLPGCKRLPVFENFGFISGKEECLGSECVFATENAECLFWSRMLSGYFGTIKMLSYNLSLCLS